MEAIKGSKKGKVIGQYTKDKFQGEFNEAWRAALKEASFEPVILLLGGWPSTLLCKS